MGLDDRTGGINEHSPSTLSAGDGDTLLPLAPFTLLCLSAELCGMRLAVIVQLFLAVVVEIKSCCVMDTSGNLVPGTLPCIRSNTASRSVLALLSQGSLTADWHSRRILGSIAPVTFLVGTLHTEPVPNWNSIDADTVCVVWCIAGITEKKLIFILLGAADRTRRINHLVLVLFLNPSKRVKFGDLLLILDFIGIEWWA